MCSNVDVAELLKAAGVSDGDQTMINTIFGGKIPPMDAKCQDPFDQEGVDSLKQACSGICIVRTSFKC